MRAMKDSGIEWIGEIPEDWEIGKISALYDERKQKVNDRDYPPLSVTMQGILPQLSNAAKTDAHDPESVKLKMSNKAERLINTALLAKLSVLKFAPNGCRKNI